MKIYFLSSTPCELTLNGIFFGIVDSFERFADVNLSDRIFAKFTPQDALPIGIFLDEALLSSPPNGVDVYIIKEGIALYVHDFPPNDCALRPIAQKRFENNLITLFQQGKIHLSLETEKGFFISYLPPSFKNGTLSFHANLFFVEGENQLAIYTKAGELVFLEKILSYSVEENTLNATLPLSDCYHRLADCSWELSEQGCKQTQFVIRQPIDKDEANAQTQFRESILPYAFFECILLKGNYAEFLSPKLQQRKGELIPFLGEFQAVTLTKERNVIGLVRKRAARLFFVDYYTVILENGRIIDIKG